MSVLGRSVVVAFVGTLLWAACGSDSEGSDDPVALCKQTCSKLAACFDGGGTNNCDTRCTQSDGGGGGGTCTNEAEITAAYKACLDKPCDTLFSCFQTIPDCKGGTTSGSGGAGGSTGGAGGTGGGGTGGGSDSGTTGGTCADLLACCNRASTDQLKTQCTMLYDSIKGTGDMGCALALTNLKSTYCP